MPHDEVLANTLRRAREHLGLEIHACAAAVGLNEETYFDSETYGDELFDNMSLGTARRICGLLKLNLIDLIAKHLRVTVEQRQSMPASQYYARHDLVFQARIKAGMSADKLGDAIGFETTVINSLERTPEFIESMPITSLVELAKTLQLDPGLIVRDLESR